MYIEVAKVDLCWWIAGGFVGERQGLVVEDVV
jgi:hypothetical protein